LSVVFIVLGSLIFVQAYESHYAPLKYDYTWFVEQPPAHQVGSFTSPRGDSFAVFVTKCREGVPLDFGFALQNDTPIGITVTRLFRYPDPAPLLEFTSPRMGPSGPTESQIFSGRRVPFRPFSLAPHQFRVIEMSVVFHKCQADQVGISSTEMSYRVLGQNRTQEVLLPYDLMFTPDGKYQS